MLNKMTHRAAALAFAAAALAAGAAQAQQYPSEPVRVTVPFGAGGGTDTLVRTLQPYVEAALGGDLVVLNKPGAGSVTGSRAASGEDADGYNLLVNHATLLTNMAVGKADFGLDAFEIAGSTTAIPLVVATPATSPINSLDALRDALAGGDPVIAGVNIGAVNHFALLMVEDALGAGDFRYVQTGGGAATTAALLGGQISVGVLSAAEAKPLSEAGEVQVIAALQDAPIDSLPDVPTAAEQGADVSLAIEHTWYFPKGTPDAVVDRMSEALGTAMNDGELQQTLAGRGMSAVFYPAAEAADWTAATLERLSSVAEGMGD
ncbi:tripartite tricarboxylate transporter substrate binding protein [Marinovum sp.]|uniref:tripartite tricarboxylate transporter substrate binding protein n=1 Tax=Marinovum sp. TaxID=2024839 RepID=UPI002B265FF7|nr:tripartite tricarboxylate transporter substrate binding protein [Marinovum sp.]